MDRCIAYAKAHPHPERSEQTVWEVFEEERPKLVPYRGRFDGVPCATKPPCRRRAWRGSTKTTILGVREARSVVRSRSTPMPSASFCAKMAVSSASIP